MSTNPKFVDRLANRYIDEYQRGGAKRAARFANQMLKSQDLKDAVNKRVKELATIRTEKR